MKLTTFIKTYARYHHNSTETIFELDNGNFLIFKPCTQEYDEKRGLFWDGFRRLWLLEREDYLGIFDSVGQLYAIVTEDGNLRINPEINPPIMDIELDEV